MDSVTADRVLLCRVSPFGNLRIKAYLRLPVAYRSLSRPSSALSAKAFPLRPLQLNQLVAKSVPFRFPVNWKAALHFLAPHLRFKPAALGFESGPPLRCCFGVIRGFFDEIYYCILQELGYISVESMFLTYPLAICSTIFRSYPNNIQKNHLFFAYFHKRNNKLFPLIVAYCFRYCSVFKVQFFHAFWRKNCSGCRISSGNSTKVQASRSSFEMLLFYQKYEVFKLLFEKLWWA